MSSTSGSINSTLSHSQGLKGSDLPPSVSSKPPHVLIAGAGIGGLFLANILEKTDITYEIFEKTKEIKPLGKLPKHDSKPLTKGFICIVGLTKPMDLEKFPELNSPCSKADAMTDHHNSYSWFTLSLPGGVVSWGTVLQIDSATFSKDHFRTSEWGPEAIEPFLKEVDDFKTPYGTLGSLIDMTIRENISKVFLEDKFFETWTSSRTVLVGDGAVNAIQDAIVLVNCLYEMKVTSYESIVEALTSYHKQRYDIAKSLYETSKVTAKIHYGHKLMERALRHIIVHFMPSSIQTQGVSKTMANRPQVSFLPLTPHRGKAPIVPARQSPKYLEKQANAAREAKEEKETT
ncbi:hypothetical protein BGX27_001308 [Mortierella sp. AM989]|nr:hypothetical protein BGX27_001308 [Mortierella sp. AM989]